MENNNDLNNLLSNYIKAMQSGTSSLSSVSIPSQSTIPNYGMSNSSLMPSNFNLPYGNSSTLNRDEPIGYSNNFANTQPLEPEAKETPTPLSQTNEKKYNPDWICPKKSCRNRNFAKRTKCNLCGLLKPSNPELDYSSFPFSKLFFYLGRL